MSLRPSPSLKTWFHLFTTGPVIRRALRYAVVVGIILVIINHGDAIVAGRVTREDILKMGLTMLVPYLVSALSSVGAMLQYGHSTGPYDQVARRSEPTRSDGSAVCGAPEHESEC